MSDGQLEAQADGGAAVNLVTGFPAATPSVTQVGRREPRGLPSLKCNDLHLYSEQTLHLSVSLFLLKFQDTRF